MSIPVLICEVHETEEKRKNWKLFLKKGIYYPGLHFK
jgi:hypothetical protein